MKLTDKKRLQILDAAETLFYSQGVEQTSMDQLALEAKVSKRTVYNHFATKELLFQAILVRMFERLSQTQIVTFDATCPLEDQLQKIAEDEVTMLGSEAFLRIAKVAILQVMQQPELAKSISEYAPGCQRYLEQFLSDACTAKELDIPDITFATKQFIYQFKAFVFYPALFGMITTTAEERQKLVKETVAMFMARYRHPDKTNQGASEKLPALPSQR